MGAVNSFSDCCVSDQQQKLKDQNEGSKNMDTKNTTTNITITPPTIKTKSPPIAYNADISTKNTITQPTKSSTISNYDDKEEEQEEKEPEPITPKPIYIPPAAKSNKFQMTIAPEPITKSTSAQHSMGLDGASKTKNGKNKQIGFKIVVTEPLSPDSQTDDHPYQILKHSSQQLISGYIRRNNYYGADIDQPEYINMIFKYFYFHYADVTTQLSILNDITKIKKSINLIMANREEDFSKFLDKILKSKLADKMWNKFDTDLKGIVETDKLIQFLTLPVILYKSTLNHRKQKKYKQKRGGKHSNGVVTKLKKDKKEITRSIEHLGVWIIRKYGKKQKDDSYYFRLTKDIYINKMPIYVERYKNEYSQYYDDQL